MLAHVETSLCLLIFLLTLLTRESEISIKIALWRETVFRNVLNIWFELKKKLYLFKEAFVS